MLLKISLGVSIISNIVMLVFIVVLDVNNSKQSSAQMINSNKFAQNFDELFLRSAFSGEGKANFSAVLSDVEYSKLAFLFVLEHVQSTDLLGEHERFWRTSRTTEIEFNKQRLAAENAVSKSLLQQYGTEAINEPLFNTGALAT